MRPGYVRRCSAPLQLSCQRSCGAVGPQGAEGAPIGAIGRGKPAPAAEASPPLAPGAKEVFAEMRDGVKLAGNLYLPAGKGPFPCVVVRTPYGKDAMYKDPRAPRATPRTGYAFLVQDNPRQGQQPGLLPGLRQRSRRWL